MAASRRRLSLFALLLCLCTTATHAASTAPSAWKDLSAQQQEILAPLKKEWNTLGPKRRNKWLSIAARYPEMAPSEQRRVTARMTDWVNLSPEQRRKARDEYQRLRKLPSDKRPALRQQWEQYKALSDAEKLRLRQLRSTPSKRADTYRPPHPQWLVQPYLRALRSPLLPGPGSAPKQD